MRTIFKWIGLVVSVFLLVSVLPAHAFGEERSYEITNVEIHARIDRDGNMHVTELDTYTFHGQFNGILVNLNSRASDGIENFQAYEVTGQQEQPLEFEPTTTGTEHEFKVYAKSENETKVFKLTYSIKNVVQVYADIAELYWKFFDETNPTTMEAVAIDVELPAEAEEDQVWYFGHGTVGSVHRLDNGIIRYEVKPFRTGEFLEARVLFPTSMVPGSKKINRVPMLESILTEEEKWAAEADEGFDFSVLGGLALLIANLAYGISVVKKYNKRFRSDWNGTYYRELPGDVTPAVVSYLMNFRTIGMLHMGAIAFDFKSKFARSPNPCKIDEIWLPSPIRHFILRMQVIKLPKKRPPNAFQKQAFPVPVPSFQAAFTLPGPAPQMRHQPLFVHDLKSHEKFPPRYSP